MAEHSGEPAGPGETAAEAERQRRLRGRNYALAAALVGFVILFYIITIVRMGGG